MRRILFTYLVLTLVIDASRVRADEQPELSDPLTLDAAVAYARAHNPEIRAARARQHAAQARPTQVGALPDPTLDLAYHNETFDRFTLGDSDFAWVRIGASQEIPFPGKLGLKADIARQTAKGTHAAAQRVEREVVSRVKIAYAEYAHLQEQHHLLERNRRLLENLARSAETKYAVGEGIQQDVVRAQLELSMIEDRAITLEQRSRSQTAELNALLNRPTTAPLGEPQHLEERHLTQSLDDLIAAAQLQAPELNVASIADCRQRIRAGPRTPRLPAGLRGPRRLPEQGLARARMGGRHRDYAAAVLCVQATRRRARGGGHGHRGAAGA